MPNLFEHPVLGRGFRPFFFLGALYSVISIAVWGLFYAGYATPPDAFLSSPVAWHAHEMIYGFTMTIIAGFLLTAVANWTGGAPVRQLRLLGLCILWLAGRIVMSFDTGLPPWLVMALDGAFVPALAVSLAVPLLRSWNKRNFVFLTFLTVLFACNIWFLYTEDMMPLYIALMVVLMKISLIGGRIIPAFTVAGLRRRGIQAFQTAQHKTDMVALLSLVLVALCLVFARDTVVLGIFAALSGIVHGLRMRHYHCLKALREPMLWILHFGYAWLVIGLFLIALTGFGVVTLPMIVHALTVGCIGSMCIGMMCRVSLGHTGRDMTASPLTIFAFALMQLAAFTRLLGPVVLPGLAVEWYVASVVMWGTCFAIYLLAYTPMLATARPDGRPA